VTSQGFDQSMPTPHATSVREGKNDWLTGGGEMGKVIRSMAWGDSPLGPIESWPQSLRTTVSLCLASNFPISIAWGPCHTQIYNDGYWPICGAKHPESMGQDFSVCWASAWPAIGQAFERALTGETSYLENQRMFLDRNGYLEETFFTFSFSPIRDETGGVGGLFHPVTETTSKMLSERRTRTLRDLAARTTKAKTCNDAFSLAVHTLAEANLDLPFVLVYLVDREAGQARLIAHAGLAAGTAASPTSIELCESAPSLWGVSDVARSGAALQTDGARAVLDSQRCGPYPELPETALSLPITLPGSDRPTAILVAGVSSRLPLNETYRAYYDLLGTGVTIAVANAHAYEEQRKRAEALAAIDRAKTAFFSNVSHEFRTPLTLMLGPLEDELREKVDPLPLTRRERLRTAHRNTLRLLKLVNTLLDFSRIEAGRTQASYQPTDLASYTAELASVFRSAIEKAGLSLTLSCDPSPEPIYVDREMWEKIVLNLLSNAFKHTFEGGIRVELRWCADHAELVVADSGVGICKEELPRLFERFHRVKGAKSRTHEGTGIGLALVHELVALHGGSVQVTSEEGKGTTFTVSMRSGSAHLPSEQVLAGSDARSTVTSAAAYEEAMLWARDAGAMISEPPPPAAVSMNAPRSSIAPPAHRARILWADDNADMRDYVSRLLADRYEVLAVSDGLAALTAAESELPDLVLSDVMMPGLDGFGLLKALRAGARTKTVPIILLSARAGEESALEGLEAGADDYLIKPFSARELLARIQTHLDLARLRRQWAEELERANKELEAFSYSVSHDLRAPLRAIDGFSRALLNKNRDQLDDEGRSYLERVRAAATRMSILIDDLLRLSRISRGPIKRDTVNIGAMARDIVDELRRGDPNRRVDVHIEPGLDARADGDLVLVALENLLRNAWKFTSKRAEARIFVGRMPATSPAIFFVRDDGAGFDMAYADKMFGPFQRLHSQADFEGTGVGLATVQRIVARHEGRVWAESEVDRGATFFFTLERPA
jgi:signal transduction histidine kinase